MPFEITPQTLVAVLALSPFAIATIHRAVALSNLRKSIEKRSRTVIDSFFHKVDKIPVIVETIRKYAPQDEIYAELVKLHRTAIIANVSSVYDILENDARISSKFRFLMHLSVRIREISHDGNFLYARSIWMYHENSAKEELDKMDDEIRKYENLRKSRAYTLFGILIPAKEIHPVKGA
ncbi:MAG: hypothetical protein QMC36_05385 [Patescibacteria group bacterium]